MPLSNVHPAARSLAINQATINRIRTDGDYFRGLILDTDTSDWEDRPAWIDQARTSGWYPKPRREIHASKRAARITPTVLDIADHFEADVRRMAGTAVATAAYANGQLVLATVKSKDIGFTRQELEDEIASLLGRQDGKCALTAYAFRPGHSNPHLRPSLDRIDSSQGYVPGNLQVVTRAANFFKSASDPDDWARKAKAMISMAAAMQRNQRA